MEQARTRGVTGKSRWVILNSAFMIFPAAFLFSVSSDLPHVFIIVLIGLAGSMIISPPLAYSDRSVIYSAMAAITLSALLNLLFPMDRDRFEIVGRVLRANLSGPFLLYLAVIITYYPSTPHTLGIGACFSLGALMLGGEIFPRQIENERLAVFNPWMDQFYWFYTVVVVIETVAVIVALRTGWRIDAHSNAAVGRWPRRAIILVSLVLVACLSVGGLHAFYRNESKLRSLELFLLRVGMSQRPRGDYVVFGDDVDLNRTISGDVADNPERIVLRAAGSGPPGYLRGRVYVRYLNGRWSAPGGNGKRKLRFEGHEGILAYKTFHRRGKNTGGVPKHIYPESTFHTDALLVPGDADRFELVADAVTTDENGVLDVSEWEKDGGYTVFNSGKRHLTAYPAPTKPERDSYVGVQRRLRQPLERFLVDAVGGSPNELEPRILIRRLLQRFKTSFTYSLETDNTASETDPVLNFLLKTRSGHCELFATAMALLLRSRGIPTRYVTGFVCMEPHPSGTYHVARLGDAHAWLEYYDAKGGRWEPLEPTPPSGIPAGETRWRTVESWLDVIKQAFARILADMRRGHFAKAIISFFFALGGVLWWLLVNPWRGPLTAVLVGWWLFKRRRSISAKARGAIQLPPELLALRRDFERLEKTILDSLGLVREKSMPIEEWGSVIKCEIGAFPDKLRQAFDGYQRLRYRGSPPKKDEVDALGELINAAALEIRRQANKDARC